MRTERRDRYLRTILLLAEQSGHETVTCGAVALALDVTAATATTMIQALAADGFVEYFPHKGVRLAEGGVEIARAALRRQRLVEAFLCKSLGLGWEEVESTAAKIAEAFPDELVERINRYLDTPHFDPHGDVIYQPGPIAPLALLTLNDFPTGPQFRVSRIIDHDPGFLRYLAEIAVTIGAIGRVLQQSTEGDLVVLQIDGHRSVAMSRKVGAKILVSLHESST